MLPQPLYNPNQPNGSYQNGGAAADSNLSNSMAKMNIQGNGIPSGQPPANPQYRQTANGGGAMPMGGNVRPNPVMPSMPRLSGVNMPRYQQPNASSASAMPSSGQQYPIQHPGQGSAPQQSGMNMPNQPVNSTQQFPTSSSANVPQSMPQTLPQSSSSQHPGQNPSASYPGQRFTNPQQPSQYPGQDQHQAGRNLPTQPPAVSHSVQQHQPQTSYPGQPFSNPQQPYQGQEQLARNPPTQPSAGNITHPFQQQQQPPNSFSGQPHPNPQPNQHVPGYAGQDQQPGRNIAPAANVHPPFPAQQQPQRPPQFQHGGPPPIPATNPGYPSQQYPAPGGNVMQQASTHQPPHMPPQPGNFSASQQFPPPGGQHSSAPGFYPPQNTQQGPPPPSLHHQQQPPGLQHSQQVPLFQGNTPNGYPPQNQQPQYQQHQPGMPHQPGQQLGPDGHAYMARNEQPKLTNDSLPSVVDVLERDQLLLDHLTNGNRIYESRLNSNLPPLVSTVSRNVDCGNSVPEMLRSSLYVAPCTPNLLKESGIPFVLHIQPMAELPVDSPPIPIVQHGEKGPVRCTRCKAYMSPYMKFIDGGRKFQCPFCMVSTEVPQEYFAYLDSEGRRVDVMQRAELCLGTYEFLGTKEYCRNDVLPQPPAFIFMIDVSYRAISSGMVALVCNMLRNELESLLPVEASGQESKLRVGIATFSDSVNFYNLKNGLKQPSMMTVTDFTDMFVPLVDGFLVRLEESGQMFDKLLEEIPKIFASSRQVDTILYPAVQAGMRALEAAGCPGKLFVFNFSLPIFDAPGKLKNRDNRELLGTDKEKTLLKPQIPDYTELAKECVSVGCSVDLFLFPSSYIDIATISEVARLTGGQVFKYGYFMADKDGGRLLWDLRRNLKRSIAFDAVMRVRTSAGIRPTDYFGNFSMPTSTEVHLASLDSDKVILAEIRHDDKLEEKIVVHIQVAVLYTSLSAQRRVRVLNMALLSTNEFSELFRTADIDVVMNFMIKNSVKGLYEYSPAAIREGLSERAIRILSAYRKYCSLKTTIGQLVLPETLKLLPIYTSCLLRNDIISGTGQEVSADDRCWLISHVNFLSVEHLTPFLYPRFFVLNEPVDAEGQHQFPRIRITGEKIRADRAYLLENGVAMFMWLGSQLTPTWLEDVFGVQSLAQIDAEKGDLALSTRSNPTADLVRKFILQTRNSRPVHMRLAIVRQGDKISETWFRRFLMEDQGVTSYQQSYISYIHFLHMAIRDEVEK